MTVLEDLKDLEKKLETAGFNIDHYEIRESYSREERLHRTHPPVRAEGVTPLEAASEWSELDGDEYVIEVFLNGKNPLDRVVYEPGGKLEYLSFSDQESTELGELLEE